MKVERPRDRLSDAPMRVKTRSMMGSAARAKAAGASIHSFGNWAWI